MSSIFQRKWRNKSGAESISWRVQFYVAGRKRYRDFRTARLAKRFAEEVGDARIKALMETEARKGPPIAQVSQGWLKACETGGAERPPLEPTTVQWYRGNLEKYILPKLGHLRVGSCTPSQVKEFRNYLLRETNLARSSAKKVLTTLKTLFGYAIEEELISLDPSNNVDISMPSRDRCEVEIHSKAEMSAILAAAARLRASNTLKEQQTWERYLPLLHVLVYGGLRLSEARGLERDAVCDGVVTVRQRADKRNRIGSPKSRQGHRRIHLPDSSAALLQSWLATHSHPLVFPTCTGRPLNGDNIRKRMWLAVQKEAQVRVFNLHSARHFFASRQIELGCNPKQLAALMGHADEAFTLRTYTHLFVDAETEAKAKARANAQVLVPARDDNNGAAKILIGPKLVYEAELLPAPDREVPPPPVSVRVSFG